MKHGTRGLFSIAAGMLLLAVGALGPTAGVSTLGAAGSAGGATGPQSFASVSCPSVMVCYAVGRQGTILATTDAGGTWQRETSRTKRDLFTIDCPAVSVCFVRGQLDCHRSVNPAFLITDDGGRTWTRRCFPGYPDGSAFACPSVTTCYLVLTSGQVVRTMDGGSDWEARGTITTAMGPRSSLTCPSLTVCYVGGAYAIGRSGDGGHTWRISHFPVPSCSSETICLEFGTIACPSNTVCLAVGSLGRVMSMVNGGRTWHDLIPAIFVSGTWSTRQQLHTYSRWFTTTGPWHVALGVYGEGYCHGLTDVTIYVQNTAKQRIGSPVHSPFWGFGEYGKTLKVSGRLRLDVVSAHCSDVTVRIDGVA